MRNTDHLIGSLPIVAQALGDKLGVRVEIGGNRAATDGSTIWIPALPPDDEAAAVLARGYIDHEAAHIRFTEGGMTGTPLERSLQNILEDVRIEAAMSARFPGSRQNLKRLAARLVADGTFGPPPADAEPGAVVCGYLMLKLRAALLGQDAMAPLAEQAETMFRQTFSEGVAIRIAALGFDVERARSTEDVRRLARRILQSLEDAANEEPSQPRGAGQEDGDQASAGGGHPQDAENGAEDSGSEPDPETAKDDGAQPESDGGGQGSGRDDADDSGPGSDPGNASGDETEGGAEGGASGACPGGGAESGKPPDPREAAGKALSASEEDLSGLDIGGLLGDRLAALSSEAGPKGAVRVAGDYPADLGRETDMLDAHRARRATVALRARLEGLLQSSRLERDRPARSGGRIDTRRLHRIAVGDSRVFRAANRRIAVNTAVSLLLDRSCSMTGLRQPTANEAVYAAALALSAIPGVALHTAAFPVRNADIATITPFGGRVVAADYAITSHGSTPLEEALWRVALMLSARPEPRRICVVATDGDPDSDDPVRAIVRRMESAGIELFALGIQTSAPARFFRNTEAISSVAEMPKALLGMLQRALLSAA